MTCREIKSTNESLTYRLLMNMMHLLCNDIIDLSCKMLLRRSISLRSIDSTTLKYEKEVILDNAHMHAAFSRDVSLPVGAGREGFCPEIFEVPVVPCSIDVYANLSQLRSRANRNSTKPCSSNHWHNTSVQKIKRKEKLALPSFNGPLAGH